MKVADILDRASERLEQSFSGSQATKGTLLNTLGTTYMGLGLYDRAVPIYTQACRVQEAALGPDHPDTLQSRNDLGEAYRRTGRLPEAVALQEATLKRREATLGPDHPDTLGSRNNLGEAYWSPAGCPRRSRSTRRRSSGARRRWAPTTPIRSAAATTWPSLTRSSVG